MSFEARAKLQSLKKEDPQFWDELTMAKEDASLPEAGAVVAEDDMDAELARNSGFGDDSSIKMVDVIRATTGTLGGTSWIAAGEGGGLVSMDLAEHEDEEPADVADKDGDGREERASGSTAGTFPHLPKFPMSTVAADSTNEAKATGRGKRKHMENKWYSNKNFIRHDDNNNSDVE